MTISDYLILYPVAFISFLLIDFIWLGFVAKGLYSDMLGPLMRRNAQGDLNPIWWAAILFYALFVAILVYFVMPRAIEANSFWITILNGALFGLVTYATYDLTNYSTLQGFPLKIVFIDIIWGMVLSASVIGVTYGVWSYVR